MLLMSLDVLCWCGCVFVWVLDLVCACEIVRVIVLFACMRVLGGLDCASLECRVAGLFC